MARLEANLPNTFGQRMAGFSLIELTLAIAIVGVAFLSLLGLIPMGMDTFRKSMDSSVTSLIAHRMLNEAQQSDFNTYTEPDKNFVIRHFDDEGQVLDDATGVVPSSEVVRVTYQANVTVTPAPELPGAQDGNENLATVTVQIAKNPLNKDLGEAGSLWDLKKAKSLSVPIVTYSSVIAGNRDMPVK